MKKTKRHGQKKHRKYTRTVKGHYDDFLIPSTTPVNIHKISNNIAKKLSNGSYSPSINKDLVTLKSIPREELKGCNLTKAYNNEEPLEIYLELGAHYYNDSDGLCIPYYMDDAKKILLKNLRANKHVDPAKIVPPIQSQSNCWFNAMFVTFFVSDKGRKFFHFLRQLMIKGTQKDKKSIPDSLRDAFALLNFGIDSALSGSEFAYELDTNSIIHNLYKNIPESYKAEYPSIVDVDYAGNPLQYYMGIINYLNNNSIQLLFVRDTDSRWKDNLVQTVDKMSHLPHIVVLEVLDKNAEEFNRKPVTFKVNDAKYQIDSAVVRDTSQQHFCATITCEGKEMGYDGMSFHRLVPLNWKHKMNSDFTWEFEGSTDTNGTNLKWNFTKSYQLLIYYRVE